jgi:7-carboxy-7-deazaguanine synthase (Cx14CxxC type)
VSAPYRVKELFLTLQGEGANAGTPAVFCRFAGCNLWTGHEEHRASAVCQFCDTDFVGVDGPGGGRFADAGALADAVDRTWSQARPERPSAGQSGDVGHRFVVCTGGEPLLQLDAEAIAALHDRGFRIAVETNGTLEVPPGLDWVCVSPKAGASLVVTTGHELKLVYPQVGAEPERYAELAFDHFFLQPMDGPDRDANTKAAIEHCLAHPQWRLSVQVHKYLGIP